MYVCIYFEREGKGEGEGETSMCGCLLHSLNQGPGPHPRQVPWPGPDQRPFSLWDDIKPTEPHQPGLKYFKYQRDSLQSLLFFF